MGKSRKVSKRSPRKVSPRKVSPRKVSPRKVSPRKIRKQDCQGMVSQKIGINIGEFKSGKRYLSKAQAIAVAYSQIAKAFPVCAKFFKRAK